MAAISPEDPWVGLASCEAIAPEQCIDVGLQGLGLEELARRGVELLQEVRGGDDRIQIDSGAVASNHERVAISSSEGARAAFEAQEASGYVFGMAVDGEEVGVVDQVRAVDGRQQRVAEFDQREESKKTC